MSKLTDLQKKKIVAEYIAGDGNITQAVLAKRYNVSQKSISTILNNPEISKKVSDKKIENTLSMLEWLDEQKNTAQSLMKKILDTSFDNIEGACLRDKMGALKILSDVFMQTPIDTKDEIVTKIVIQPENAGEEGKESDTDN